MLKKRIHGHNQRMDYHNLNPKYNRTPKINFKQPCEVEDEKYCSVGGQFGIDADTLIFCDTCSDRDTCIKEKNTL